MTIADYSALSVLIVLVIWRTAPIFARWRSISVQHKSREVKSIDSRAYSYFIGGAGINS